MEGKRNAVLEAGRIYQNRGGGKFRCLISWGGHGQESRAVVRNIDSGWRCTAHGITMYEDGTIEWDYSAGGFFDKEWKAAMADITTEELVNELWNRAGRR